MDYDKLFEMIKDLKEKFDTNDTDEFKQFTNEVMSLSDEEFNKNTDSLAIKLKDIMSKLNMPGINPYDIDGTLKKMMGELSLDYQQVQTLFYSLNPQYQQMLLRFKILGEKIKQLNK